VIIRSLIFPGWGQLYNNNKLKGWILTSLGAITISSAVYFIIDSNNKQKKYLNDVNLSTIQNNYNEYNTSYKLKNISIISFIAVWVYSQIDILFFSQNNSLPLTQLKTNFMNQFQLNFSLSF
jgi:TM2 domain-containing membrane protein YozV